MIFQTKQFITLVRPVTLTRQTHDDDMPKEKEEAARMLTIMNTVLDGLVTIDEYGTIQTFNLSAVRIFSYQPDEVIGKNVNMLMPEPYHSGHDGYLSRYLATGEAHIIGTAGREVSAKRKDGSVFPKSAFIEIRKL